VFEIDLIGMTQFRVIGISISMVVGFCGLLGWWIRVVVLFAPCFGCSEFVLSLYEFVLIIVRDYTGFFSGRIFCLSHFVGLEDLRFDSYYIGMYKC